MLCLDSSSLSRRSNLYGRNAKCSSKFSQFFSCPCIFRIDIGNFIYSHVQGTWILPEGHPKNESAHNCSALPLFSSLPFLLSFLIGHDFNFWFTPFSQPSFTIHRAAAAAAWCPNGDSSRCSRKFIFPASLWTSGLRRRPDSQLVSQERTASLPR